MQKELPKSKNNNTGNKVVKKDKTNLDLANFKESNKIIDSLKNLKRKNEVYLNKMKRKVNIESAKLDEDFDSKKISFLSDEKTLLEDSIYTLNFNIDEEINRLNNSKVKPNSRKVKDRKENLDFDNITKIDTNSISKENKEKFIKGEKEKQTKPKKDKDIKIVSEVGTVVIRNENKKIKYKIGDVVERPLQEKSRFYLSRAKLEIDKSNISKAKDYIDKSIKLNPSLAEAYMLKGDIYSSFTYYDKAVSQYKKASFLDPKNVVIEILEDVPITDELIDACKELKAKGFKFALDDHDFDPKWDIFFL